MKQKDLADKMGIKAISLSQMLARKKFGLDKLEEMANIIGCKVTDLFEEDKTNDFAAYIRYKGIHYTADNLEDLNKIVEEINMYDR